MTVLDTSLFDLADQIGDLPSGDTPVAWWISAHPDVLEAYDNYHEQRRTWNDLYAELLAVAHLPTGTSFVAADAQLQGLVPPKDKTKPSRWFRRTSAGLLIPRKRTRDEKVSVANTLWDRLLDIPVPHLPGMPPALVTAQGTYPVAFRHNVRLGRQATVCAYVGVDPKSADPAFDVGGQWSRMKMSTYHMLQERQRAREEARQERRREDDSRRPV